MVEAQGEKNSALAKEDAKQWNLYMDSASNDTGSGAGIMLISPEGHKIHCALWFRFKASNNEAKYDCTLLKSYKPATYKSIATLS